MDLAQQQATTVMVGLHQDLLGVFVIVKPDGNMEVIGAPWKSPREKLIILIAIKEHLRRLNAVAFSFVGEAWTATNPPDNPLDMTPASQRPADQRKEIVMSFASDRRTKLRQFFDIIRDAEGRCIDLLPEERRPAEKDAFFDRLIDLL
jgi:hypothetical protein